MIQAATFAVMFILFLACFHVVHLIVLRYRLQMAGTCWATVGVGLVAMVATRLVVGEENYRAIRAYWPILLVVAVGAVYLYDEIQTRFFDRE